MKDFEELYGGLLKKGFFRPEDLAPPVAGGSDPGRTEGPAPSDLAPLRPGDSFHGLKILDFLGRGGMGHVYKARHLGLDKEVALKILDPSLAQDPGFALRFEREARTLASLDHPSIVGVTDSGCDDGLFFLVMEYVEGVTLDRFPREDRRALVRLLRDAASAVGFAHRRGIVHRDLKPANLMVETAGSRLFVTDFGLARPTRTGGSVSMSGTVVGTPVYMSPEQARGDRADIPSDVYSLGATLYELLTGRPPFAGESVLEILRRVEEDQPVPPRAHDRTLDRDLETIVLKCLEKDPARRYAAADDLAADLGRFLEGEPILARRASPLYRVRRYLARRRRAALAASVALVVLVVVSTTLVVRVVRERRWMRAYQDGLDLWENVVQHAGGPSPDAKIGEKARQARRFFEEANRIDERAEPHLMRGRCLQIEALHDEAERAWERALALDPDAQDARFQLAKVLLLRLDQARDHGRRPSPTATPAGPPPEAGTESRRTEALLADFRGSGTKNELLQGLLALQRAEYAAAGGHLSNYTRTETWDAVAMKLEGDAWYHARDLDKAEAAFRKALRFGPDLFAYRGLANVCHHSGRHQAAAESATEALKLAPRDPGLYVTRGRARGELAQPDAAIADFNLALRLDARNIHAYMQRGLAKGAKGDFEGAMADHGKAVELDANNPAVLGNRGMTRRTMGDLAGAIEDYTRALALDPTDIYLVCNRAFAKNEQGDLEGALADYMRGVELDPKCPVPYVGIGDVKNARGDRPAALAQYARAIEADPRHAPAYNQRGLLKRAQRDLKGALADYDKAIESDPTYAPAYSNRGVVRNALGDVDGDIADQTRALELNPRNAHAWHNRGVARRVKGDNDGAIEDHARAIELNPRYALAFKNRAHARSAKGDSAGAIEDYTRALELEPRDAAAWTDRGVVRRALGDVAGAIEDHTRAIELNPSSLKAHVNRSAARRFAGDLDGALADASRAVELDPKFVQAYLQRAAAHRARGDHQAAIGDCTKAIGLNDKDAAAWGARGLAKRAAGDLDAALPDLTRAIELDPKSADHWSNRAVGLYAARSWTRALIDFTKACELQPDRLRARLFVWLIRARLGERDAATAELRSHLEGDSARRPDRSSLILARFLIGDVTESQLLEGLPQPPGGPDREHAGWAHLLAGTKRLLDGDRKEASAHFRRSLELAPRDSAVITIAGGEVRSLESGP